MDPMGRALKSLQVGIHGCRAPLAPQGAPQRVLLGVKGLRVSREFRGGGGGGVGFCVLGQGLGFCMLGSSASLMYPAGGLIQGPFLIVSGLWRCILRLYL